MMDILTCELEKCLKNSDILPVMRAAVARGLAIIDKYYSKTDESIMWKTAMSTLLFFLASDLTLVLLAMHPRYKLDYFRSQNWLTDWIKTAEDSVRETWVKYYKPTITEKASDSMVIVFISSPPLHH